MKDLFLLIEIFFYWVLVILGLSEIILRGNHE